MGTLLSSRPCGAEMTAVFGARTVPEGSGGEPPARATPPLWRIAPPQRGRGKMPGPEGIRRALSGGSEGLQQLAYGRDDAVLEPGREGDRPAIEADRARGRRAAQLGSPAGLVSALGEHPVGGDIAGHLVRVAGNPDPLRRQLPLETQPVVHADFAGER